MFHPVVLEFDIMASLKPRSADEFGERLSAQALSPMFSCSIDGSTWTCFIVGGVWALPWAYYSSIIFCLTSNAFSGELASLSCFSSRSNSVSRPFHSLRISWNASFSSFIATRFSSSSWSFSWFDSFKALTYSLPCCLLGDVYFFISKGSYYNQ